MYEMIKLDIQDRVAIVTLNNPEKMNAINPKMIEDMCVAMDEIAANDDVRALILWGGEKLFGAGVDLTRNREGEKRTALSGYEFSRSLHRMADKIASLPKPTIAAVGGYALGGCMELTLACDIRIFSEDAKVGLPEIRIGAIPCGGGTQRLARLIGTGRAKEIIFTCAHVSAEDSYRLGIANQVVPSGTLMDAATALAQRMTALGPIGLRLSKQAVDEGLEGTLEAGLEIEARCYAMLLDTEDLKEGIVAFAQKRKPNFTGK